MRPIKKILAPTDFSSGANAALDEAIGLARLSGASITLLHVFQLPMPMGGLDPSITADTIGALEVASQEALTRAKVEADRLAGPEPRPAITTRLCMGLPYLAIVDEVRAGGYDLIVMGTHGRTGLKHLLVGSIAERVVRLSPCPVLTVRAPDEAAAP